MQASRGQVTGCVLLGVRGEADDASTFFFFF